MNYISIAKAAFTIVNIFSNEIFMRIVYLTEAYYYKDLDFISIIN